MQKNFGVKISIASNLKICLIISICSSLHMHRACRKILQCASDMADVDVVCVVVVSSNISATG